MGKFETWKKIGDKPEKEISLGERAHRQLTDPEVDNLLDARKKWQEEFEKREEEKRKKLKEAESSGELVYKDK